MIVTFTDDQDNCKSDLSNFTNTVALVVGSITKIQIGRKFFIWKQNWIQFKTSVEARRQQAIAYLEMAIMKLGRTTIIAFFHQWHVETLHQRMKGHEFYTIVSQPALLKKKLEETPGLLTQLVNCDTMSVAFQLDNNLFAKVLQGSKTLICPECSSAGTEEFFNKNAFEYPVEWQEARSVVKRVDKMIPNTAVIFVIEVILEISLFVGLGFG